MLIVGSYLPETKQFVNSFMKLNPSISNTVSLSRGRPEREVFGHLKIPGYYRLGCIVVSPEHCTKPGRGYSWPRHCSDRTELGVTAHELGHHVHLSYSLGDVEEIAKSAIEVKTHRVSSYEPNPDEIFAETFRVFSLNPDLLEQGRPARFRWLKSLGLQSPTTVDWKTALGDCPPRIIVAAEKWLLRKK